jgi:uncharacterized protein with LGFP repeats
VRRLLPGLLAFLVLTGLVLVFPVFSMWGPEPEPVPAQVEVLELGSVSAPGPDVEVRSGTTEPVDGAPEAVPTLTVRRTAVAEFSMVGVTWAHDPAVTDTLVQVRVQDEAGAWGDWTQIGVEEAAQNPDADSGAVTRGGAAPLWTGPSTGVEVELLTRSGAQPVDVKLDLIDPGTSDADGALDSPDIQDTADAASEMPAVYSRAQWGADERKRTWQPEYAPTIRAATVHHTADSNGYTRDQVPAVMRSIYHYHAVSRGWGDIGYNVIVDKFGRLWEGRAGGLASTVIGAHAGGFNTGTFGVSMLGNYDVVDTTPAITNSVGAIIAWKFGLYGVNPRGTTTVASVPLPTIFAHRDVGSTACPGRYGYARMGQIRDIVASRVVDIWAISRRYDSDPALRTLLGAVATAPGLTADGKGAYAEYANGKMFYSRATGARVMRGAVLNHWTSVGGERGPLGYPTSDVQATADGKGQYATFQGGTIYWSPTTGTRTMMGAIDPFYASVGGAAGPLGYPTKSVSWLPDKVGQYATFQHGTIYWSPTTGTRTMMGAIDPFYASVGGAAGPLGYPTKSMSWLPDKVGQYATFQHGTIYWSPTTGAHSVRGAFLTAWTGAGAQGGRLGYPTSEAYPVTGGSRQDFQRGTITVSTAGNVTVQLR